MNTSINFQSVNDSNITESFYVFECNSPDVNRKFLTFIHGDYTRKLGDLNHTMIFQVGSVMPSDWNNSAFKDLRDELLPYEVAHKMMAIPVYRLKHSTDIWDIIIKKIIELNTSYLQFIG